MGMHPLLDIVFFYFSLVTEGEIRLLVVSPIFLFQPFLRCKEPLHLVVNIGFSVHRKLYHLHMTVLAPSHCYWTLYIGRTDYNT
uniref:Putative secreted protein n=1 Tax=Panstrongylus lignarius TaxID=156445 RepID=A0A224XZG8_9HEMI